MSAAPAARAGQPLADIHAVVTGSGRGIGAAVARELAALGARLTLMGRDAGRLEAGRAALEEASGGPVLAVPVDVTDPGSVSRAFAAAARGLGAPGILVNNAGAAESAPFARTDLALWRRMLEVNLTGAFLCSREALPAMLAAGAGRIVSVASTAGLTGYPYVTAYCAAKHGLVGLTRALAREVARSGVTVNAVCPGYTDTDLVTGAVAAISARTGRTAEAVRGELARVSPQGRLVRPEEVASAVGWLCLPGQASVTGQAIVVAGGEIMP